MFYVDSHIHMQDYKTKDIKSIVLNAQKFNVLTFVNPSAHPSDWPQIDALTNEYAQIIPAYGIHPWHTQDAPNHWQSDLEQKLKNNPFAWVGECGFDRLKNQDISAQAEIFETHLALAQKYNRPLIIHAVKADNILARYFDRLPTQTVFHSWTGSVEWGKQIQTHGFFIGLNFSILHKKNTPELIKSLNLSQILLETDGPYQSGQKDVETMPQNLPLLAQKIAEIRNISTDYLAQILYRNWLSFSGGTNAANA